MDDIQKLVIEQYKELNLENRKLSWDLKQSALSSRCQNIIYHVWGFSNQNTWDKIDKYVEELIPSEYEDEEDEEEIY